MIVRPVRVDVVDRDAGLDGARGEQRAVALPLGVLRVGGGGLQTTVRRACSPFHREVACCPHDRFNTRHGAREMAALTVSFSLKTIQSPARTGTRVTPSSGANRPRASGWRHSVDAGAVPVWCVSDV